MATRTKKPKKVDRPKCVFCGRDQGVSFSVFTPRFKPFGTACTECEETLPAGTVVPVEVQSA